MLCLNCESPNVTLAFEDDDGIDAFCCEECCRFYMKNKRNEQMDDVIRITKKYLKMLAVPPSSSAHNNLHIKTKRMFQCRILVATQIKIGNLELIRSMRTKYIEVLGELDEECNELVKNGVPEIVYFNLCESVKESLSLFDNTILTME